MRTQKNMQHTRRLSTIKRNRLQPKLESLEDRSLLAVNFTAAPLITPAARFNTPLGRISGFSPIEPLFAVNPRDPGSISVSSHAGIRVSTNGGDTFTGATNFPGSTGGDTAKVFDNAGRLFWVNLATPGLSIVQVNPTTGTIIPGTQFPIDNQGSAEDKPFLAVDLFNNNLYCVWTRFAGGNQILIRRSTNQGQTWSPSVRVELASEGFTWPAAVAVDRNTGFVHVAYHSVTSYCGNNPCNGAGRIINVRLNNDLTNPQRRVVYGPNDADISFNVQTAGSQRVIPGMRFWTQGAGQPWILPDTSRPGNVYIIAADANNRANDPMDVRIARSTDNGLTWGAPTFVDVGPGISAQMFPNAAIDRFGNIIVSWYDNRRGLTNGAGRFMLDVFARYSIDGGVNWSTAFQVNAIGNHFDPDPGAINRFNGPPPTTRIGEYYGIGIFGGTVYFAWNGNSFSGATRVGHQVWFNTAPLRGSLTVTGTTGGDSILVRSTNANNTFVEVLVNGVREYAGLWTALTGITINAGNGNDVINIENVVGTPITVNAGNDNDTVNIAPTTRDLDLIQAAVTVNAGAGLDALTINDQNNTSLDTWTLNSDNVRRTGVGLTISYSGFSNGVTINGGTGGNTYNLRATPTGARVMLNGGTSADTFNVGSTSNTLNDIRGNLTLNGAGGSDTLNLNDQGGTGSLDYFVNATTVTGSGFPATITYSNMEGLTVRGASAGNNGFWITSTAAGTPVTAVGSGSDYLIRTIGATTWAVTGADAGTMTGAGIGANLNFLGCIYLIGSPGDDNFVISDGQGVSGYIDGTTGVNTLDYSGWFSSGVYVDLFSTIAFQGTPFMYNIANVFGGAGDDFLHGDGQDNWLVGNGGHDMILGDEGADYIQGGTGADQLYGGNGADWLEGGFGEDLLIDGTTSYDYDVTALSEIWAEWTRMDGTDYHTRIDNLRNGTGLSTYLLDSGTVFTDADADVLLGEDDFDWFWATDGFDFLDRIDPDEFLN